MTMRERKQTDTSLGRQAGTPRAGTSGAYPQFAAMLLMVLLLFVGLAIVGLRGGGAAEPLKPLLLATGEWSPYSGEGLPEKGVASAVVSAVLQQMGYQPQYRFLPWARTELVAYEDENDKGVRGAFPYLKTPERAERFYFSEPIIQIGMGVYFARERNPDAANIRTEADLAGYEVIPVSGYRYSAVVEKHLARMPAVSDNVAAFRLMLQSPKRLLVAEATPVAADVLRTALAADADRIGQASLSFSNPIHFMASRRNPENSKLIREFNATLRRMQGDGSLDVVQAGALAAIDARRMVRLQALAPRGEIEAFAQEGSAESVLLPQGTQALVERWSNNFLRPTGADRRSPARVQIRIMNGPLRGQRLYVDERAIVLP